MKDYNAVVIGAGNSGIAAGLALAQEGYKPLVIERHNLPGGCASSFVRGRFEFDASLHTLDYESIFKPVLENEMGLKSKFPKVKGELCNVYIEDGKPIVEHYVCDDTLGQQIESKHPGCLKSFNKIMHALSEVESAFEELTSGKPNMLKVLRHPLFFKFGTKSLENVFDAYNAPSYLRSLMSIFWWYGGIKPESFPFAVYSMVSYSAFVGHVNFPKETAHGYLAEIERKIRENGGDIWYNTEVTKINTKDGKVCSIKTNKGDVINTDLVVSAINPKTLIDNMLVGEDKVKEEILPKYDDIKENFSFFTIYLGLDCSVEKLGLKEHHTYINEDSDINKIYDYMSTFDGPKTIGVNCPNVTVPDFSPEGTCVVTISVPVQGGILEGLSQDEYFKMKHKFEKEYIAKVEKYLNIDLSSHIEEIETATPSTLCRYAGLYNGALGNLPEWTMSQKNRSITSELNKGKIKGLTFIGQYAGNLGYQNLVAGYESIKSLINGGNKHE